MCESKGESEEKCKLKSEESAKWRKKKNRTLSINVDE